MFFISKTKYLNACHFYRSIFLSFSSVFSSTHFLNGYLFDGLLYAHSKETVDNGLNVIIDIQLCSWRYARNALQYVNEMLHNKNAKLYAVRSEVFLDNCTKSQHYLDVSSSVFFYWYGWP